jgi:cytochrome P450
MNTLAEQYNPFVSPQLEDPYPTYARARREAPVFLCPALQMWIVSRYDDITAVLKDHATFSSADMLKNSYEHAPEALQVLKEGGYARMPLTVDNSPPSHTRVRGAVNKAFTPRRTATLEPIVRAITEELIDGFAPDGKGDLMESFAVPLALQTIMRFIGVPLEDMKTLKAWSDDWAAFIWAPLPKEGQIKCAESMVAYLRYGMNFVEERRRSPRDDLMSDLIRGQAEGAESALSDAEMAYMINDLIFAGHETTTNGLANSVKALLSHPDQLALLREQPELLPAAVEELLRADPPSQCLMRTVTREAQVAGVTLAAGTRLCLMLGSASHDEAVFPDPERVDLKRKNLDRTLVFGQGIHSCLGPSLARLEIRVALEILTRRLRNLRLVPDQTFVYKPNLIFRGVTRLEIMWDERAA